jgi:hypothetical protein
MIINSVLCMLYYNVIISWALFYFVSSFRTNLLWKKCGYWWNNKKCFVPGTGNSPYTTGGITYNCTVSENQNSMFGCVPTSANEWSTATEQFF